MGTNMKLFLMAVWIMPFLACSSGGSNKGGDILLPASGKVHEHLSCKENTLYTYSLYLPSSCANRFNQTPGSKKFPVVLAFDPSGDGSLPVKLYSKLAEKYGFILVGSNDSRNMQPPAENEAVVDAMFREIENRLPIDTSAIYLMGFSGGSRVATAAAMYRPIVKGIIGCGAGFPSNVQPPMYKFDYFGIAGLGDFNLSEMVALDKTLAQMNFRHFFLEFDGIHGWPGTKEIEKAWLWHLFNAMKDLHIKKIDSLVASFTKNMTADYDSLVIRARLLYARQALAYSISCMNGLADVSALKGKLASLEASAGYRDAMKKFSLVMEQEQKDQQMLMEAMYGKDLKWWKARIDKYRKNTDPRLSAEDTLMNHRMLAFLGLLCYSNATALVKQNDLQQLKLVIGVYTMVEPENSEPYYVMAVMNARVNDTVQALNWLGKSVDNGFRNKARAQSQPEFTILKDNTKFFDLIKRMK